MSGLSPVKYSALLLVFVTLCNVKVRATGVKAANPQVNNRPIIGVVGQDSRSLPRKTWISATYVKFLEQAGARVVPVRGNQPPAYYKNIVDSTNGLLFPGGAVSLTSSQFARSVRYLWQRVLQINKAGEHYPIWGTCMGFQALCNLTAGVNLLKPTQSTANVSWPLDLVADYSSSRLFGSAPPDVIKYLTTENVTQNQHSYSILAKDFESSILSKFFRKLSTNKDGKGQEFISTVEARDFPIYGSQWHPEKNNMNWNPNYVINHSSHAVQVSQFIANFFVNEARRNDHHFPDVMAEAKHLIQNYPLRYKPDGTFNQIYFID